MIFFLGDFGCFFVNKSLFEKTEKNKPGRCKFQENSTDRYVWCRQDWSTDRDDGMFCVLIMRSPCMPLEIVQRSVWPTVKNAQMEKSQARKRFKKNTTSAEWSVCVHETVYGKGGRVQVTSDKSMQTPSGVVKWTRLVVWRNPGRLCECEISCWIQKAGFFFFVSSWQRWGQITDNKSKDFSEKQCKLERMVQQLWNYKTSCFQSWSWSSTVETSGRYRGQ